MKSLIPVFLFLPIFCSGQIPAPDFTLTDIDGNSRNLYTECDAGKTVVLDFFSTLCGTCATNTPVLENIWQTYGHQGDSLYVWGIESTGVSDSLVRVFADTYGSTFPVFGTSDDDVVIYIYNITYTPQYFVVCPDRTMKPYQIGYLSEGVSLCSLNSISDKNTMKYPLIFCCNDKIIIENTGEKELNSVIEIYDTGLNMYKYKLEMGAGESFELPLKHSGIVLYRMIDSGGNVLCKGKLFSE